MSPNEVWTCPHDEVARTQDPGCQRSSCGSVRRGRGGDGKVSDVVKAEGAESDHPRSPDLRNDTGTAISSISGQQNKVTHTPNV